MASKRTAFTEEQCRQFVAASDPHQWLLTADNLHGQAVALYNTRGRRTLALRVPGQGPLVWDDTNRSTFLLAAFALENAIKAFLVYEHPEYVANGHLGTAVRSHKLVALSALSAEIPYRDRDAWVLAAFEEGNESWMRYPCGRNADEIQHQAQMTAKLWIAYLRVIRGYGRKLKRLLKRGWNGPHGQGGTWETTFEWFE